jgi:O-antigen ligase
MIDTTFRKLQVKLFLFFLSIQILFYFLNSDLYFQVSGFFLPLVIALLFSILFLLQSFKKITAEYMMCLGLLFILIGSCIINHSQIQSGYLLSYALLFLMTAALLIMPLEYKQIGLLSKAYVLSAAVISLMILILQKRYFVLEANRLSIQIGSNPVIDPNYLGAFLVAPFVLSMKSFFEKRGSKRLLDGCMILIIGGGVLLTGSRGAWVSIFLAAILIFWHRYLRHINAQKMIVAVGIAITVTILILFFLPQETLERMLGVSQWMDGSNIRRFALWENAMAAIKKNPLLGYGLIETRLSFGNVTGMYQPAHNTYLEIWGQLGFFAVLLTILLLFKGVFKKNGDPYARAIRLATFCFSIFLSSEATFYFWFNIALCFLMERTNREETVS